MAPPDKFHCFNPTESSSILQMFSENLQVHLTLRLQWHLLAIFFRK